MNPKRVQVSLDKFPDIPRLSDVKLGTSCRDPVSSIDSDQYATINEVTARGTSPGRQDQNVGAPLPRSYQKPFASVLVPNRKSTRSSGNGRTTKVEPSRLHIDIDHLRRCSRRYEKSSSHNNETIYSSDDDGICQMR